MKILTLLLTILLTSSAFAGGSQVGTLSEARESYLNQISGGSVGTIERIINGKLDFNKPEIIFNFGQNQNEIQIGYGTLVNNEWQIEKIKLPTNLNQIDPAILQALDESAMTKTWAQIK